MRSRSNPFLLILGLVAVLGVTFSSSSAPIAQSKAVSQDTIAENRDSGTIFLPMISSGLSGQQESLEPQTADEIHFANDLVGMSMDEIEAGIDPDEQVQYDVSSAAAVGPANKIGRWSNKENTPVIPVFVALMPDKNVLMWDSVGDQPAGSYRDHSFTRATVWNPRNNNPRNVNVDGYNIFCAGFVHLPDGRLLAAGGNKNVELDGISQTHIFNHRNSSWSLGQEMASERWYPSLASTQKGEVFIMGGGPKRHEVYQQNGRIRQNVTIEHTKDYPFVQATMGERILYAGPQPTMRMINPAGGGSATNHGNINGQNTYRSYASYAMYDAAKGLTLVTGGARPAIAQAIVIDSGDGTPSSRATSNMLYPRRQHNLTILPDGRVLATGGLSGNQEFVDLGKAVNAAEVWDPATGGWTEWADMKTIRQYHSTALLLPDGRIMTAGGGVCEDCQQNNYLEKNVEYFSPPYLFNSAGQRAARPVIRSASANVRYKKKLTINTRNAASIRKVTLVKLGASTHSQNMGQRFVELKFERKGFDIKATAPANANIAPPGYYMLFIINNNGVPSVAEMVQVYGNGVRWSPPMVGQTTYDFDFGTKSSPLRRGWARVAPNTNTGIVSWSGAGVRAADRGNAGGVNKSNRDFVYGSGTTNLNLRVGNGTWRVTMKMGDRTFPHDNMRVRAEGQVINNNVDSAAGKFVSVGTGTSKAFNVNVNDGVLNIQLSDGGGSDSNWVLNSISLEKR